MCGSVLYPLNELREIYPDVYAAHVKKYDGREVMLTRKIPPLNCLWNDVLHFTAVTPGELKANLAKADIALGSDPWFKVPISSIDAGKVVVFPYKLDQNTRPNFELYEVFDLSRMSDYRQVPQETIEYYKQKKAEGALPLLFYSLPHVLYKGVVETEGLEVVHP